MARSFPRVKPQLRAAAHYGDGDDENGLYDDAAQAYLAAASRIVSTCSHRSSAGDGNYRRLGINIFYGTGFKAYENNTASRGVLS